MIDKARIQHAQKLVSQFLSEGILRKESNKTAQSMYRVNAEQSLLLARRVSDESGPALWVTVISYYAMFYKANELLLSLGYRTTGHLVHQVTAEALIALIHEKLRKELLAEYALEYQNAEELAAISAGNIIESFEQERKKRSHYQYEMTATILKERSLTSLERASQFYLEIEKLL